MSVILHFLFFFFLFFLHFVTLLLSPHSLSFFLSPYLCSFMVKVVLWFSLSGCYCCDDDIVHGESPLYIAYRDGFFTILPFNYLCLDVGVLPDHPLVCLLPNHHHLPVLAVPLPITRQRKLFCLLVHHSILIHHSVHILFYYLLWHAPSGSNSSFPFLGGMSSQQDISPKRVWAGTPE